MANLAGVVQQLRKERDQAARTVERLDAALAALNGDSYGRKSGTRVRFQQQEGLGSRLPRDRDGRKCVGIAGRNRTCSQCPRRKLCQPPPGGRLPPRSVRDGRR
jgi:hypothetical protein